MATVKIMFMLVGFAGAISFLRAGSLSRNNFQGKKFDACDFRRLLSQLECGNLPEICY